MKPPAKQAGKKTDSWLRNSFDADNLFPSRWMNAFDEDSLSVNILENSNCFCIDIIAPCFKKEDFKVNIEDGIITIIAVTATLSHYVNNNTFAWKNEFNNHSFSRSFRLPENIKEDLITASYKDGTLKLNIPKNFPKAKKEIQIK